MTTHIRYRCPHCGESVARKIGGPRGRPKTAYYEVRGVRKHIDDWAYDLETIPQNIRSYFQRGWTMEQVHDRLRNPDYKRPGPKQGHVFSKRVKYAK